MSSIDWEYSSQDLHRLKHSIIMTSAGCRSADYSRSDYTITVTFTVLKPLVRSVIHKKKFLFFLLNCTYNSRIIIMDGMYDVILCGVALNEVHTPKSCPVVHRDRIAYILILFCPFPAAAIKVSGSMYIGTIAPGSSDVHIMNVSTKRKRSSHGSHGGCAGIRADTAVEFYRAFR